MCSAAKPIHSCGLISSFKEVCPGTGRQILPKCFHNDLHYISWILNTNWKGLVDNEFYICVNHVFDFRISLSLFLPFFFNSFFCLRKLRNCVVFCSISIHLFSFFIWPFQLFILLFVSFSGGLSLFMDPALWPHLAPKHACSKIHRQ